MEGSDAGRPTGLQVHAIVEYVHRLAESVNDGDRAAMTALLQGLDDVDAQAAALTRDVADADSVTPAAITVSYPDSDEAAVGVVVDVMRGPSDASAEPWVSAQLGADGRLLAVELQDD